MNIWILSWKNIWAKPLNTFMSVLLLALAIGMISMLLHVDNSFQKKIERNIAGIDMVVGAKGSPLQLILASIFHVDNPTGNIDLVELEKLKKNRLVASAIPLSYGDSYRGFRIVGTSLEYPEIYGAELEDGVYFSEVMEVVIGAKIANDLGLKVGDEFFSMHGFQEVGEEHGDHPFKVTGVLAYSNSVVDQLILTNIESIWHVHEHGEEPTEDVPKEITSILVNFSGPMGLIRMPRAINDNTDMQAAVVSFEVSRLMGLLGVGTDIIGALGLVLILVSAISIFISLYSAINERKYEMALMRTYGAGISRLSFLVILEAIFITLLGFVFGVVLSRIGLVLMSGALSESFHFGLEFIPFLPQEISLLAGALAIGFLAGLLPAYKATRVVISKTLSEG